jgi:hypothetical protein
MKRLIETIKNRLRRKPLLATPVVSESALTEVYLKTHGWQKLLSQGEDGTHEGLYGKYYLVDGFGKVHEKYCKHFR